MRFDPSSAFFDGMLRAPEQTRSCIYRFATLIPIAEHEMSIGALRGARRAWRQHLRFKREVLERIGG